MLQNKLNSVYHEKHAKGALSRYATDHGFVGKSGYLLHTNMLNIYAPNIKCLICYYIPSKAQIKIMIFPKM